MRTEAAPTSIAQMIMGPILEKHKRLSCFGLLSFVPKLRPRDVRNIDTYLKKSNAIEILEPTKIGSPLWNSFIFYTLAFSAASSTRVKAEVQALYRPPLSFQQLGPSSNPSK
jgi:hypothetical protein